MRYFLFASILCPLLASATIIEPYDQLMAPYDMRDWTDNAIDLTAVNVAENQRLVYYSESNRLTYISSGDLLACFVLDCSSEFLGIFAWSALVDWENGFIDSDLVALLGDLGDLDFRLLALGEVTGVGFYTGVYSDEELYDYAWLLAEFHMDFLDPAVDVMEPRWGFYMPVENSESPLAPFTYDFDCTGYLTGCIFGKQQSETSVHGLVSVSEPSILALVTIGLAGLGLARRRRLAAAKKAHEGA